jgi:hypothetical protein
MSGMAILRYSRIHFDHVVYRYRIQSANGKALKLNAHGYRAWSVLPDFWSALFLSGLGL